MSLTSGRRTVRSQREGTEGALTALLTHRHVAVRILAAWGIGLAILAATWNISYYWLPPGILRGWSVSVASWPRLESGTLGVPALALRIALRNAVAGGGATVLASLFTVGRFPLGYLAPWAWFGFYGVLLGTNSFAHPNLAGPLAPTATVAWTRSGIREISAYLLIAAAFANLGIWQQRSWWNWRVEQVQAWTRLRLSRTELLSLFLALVLLGWSAYVEAWQIIRLP